MEKDLIFTDRELSILRLMACGLTNKEIGKELSISYHTVKVYNESIFRKLDVKDRVSASVEGYKKGFIE